MSPWIPLIGFVAWTCGVAFYADRYGHARAEQACQEERDAAAAKKAELEEHHARAARKFEEDRQHDQDFIAQLQERQRKLARSRPVDCRIGPDRLHVWRQANAGRPLSGEPDGEVPDRVPPAGQ